MMEAQASEISFVVPWGVIQAKRWGPSNGKPILGLHGWMDNANTFDKLAPLLPTTICFVAMDFSGHGKSSHLWPAIPYTLFEYLADVKEVVTQLGWEKFSIIGHSLGANVASLYAGTFPHEVESLVLIEYRASILNTDKLAHLLAKLWAPFSSSKKQIQHVYPTIESAAERRVVSRYGNSLRLEDAKILMERGTKEAEDRDGFIFSHDPRLKHFDMPHCVPSLDTYTSILSNIKCAVLVLQGKNVKLKGEWERNVNTICQHGHVCIKRQVSGGHHTHLEYPNESALEIGEFLLQQSITHKVVSNSKL